jgi:hypothetical protein
MVFASVSVSKSQPISGISIKGVMLVLAAEVDAEGLDTRPVSKSNMERNSDDQRLTDT